MMLLVSMLIMFIGAGAVYARFNVNSVKFGMSSAQAKKAAKSLLLLEEEAYVADDESHFSYLDYYVNENHVVASSRILFEFYDDALVSITVYKMPDTDAGAGAAFYDMYRKATARYVKLYGESDVAHVIWRDRLVEIPEDVDRGNIRAGMAKGYVSCYSGLSAKGNDGYAAYTGVRSYEHEDGMYFEFYDVYRYSY